MMHAEQIRDYCLLKEEVEESFPFGPDTPVFKIRGKIFLLLSLDEIPLKFNVKCDPDEAVQLRAEFQDNVLPGYHMNKKHWNTIIVNGKIRAELIRKMIDDSYRLVRK